MKEKRPSLFYRGLYYLFDSFEGLPASGDIILDAYLKRGNDNGFYKANDEDLRFEIRRLAEMLRRPDLPSRFHIIKGYFEDTVPKHRADAIAILRLDGDLYSSTKVVLDSLYDNVSPNGWVIIDDYHWKPPKSDGTKLAKAATDEFRAARNIRAPMVENTAGKPSWQKPKQNGT